MQPVADESDRLSDGGVAGAVALHANPVVLVRMKKTVYLHIGIPKTGTSLIQGSFMQSPELLARFGIHYLQAGTRVFDDGGHHVLVMATLGEDGRRIDPGKDPKVIAQAWDEAIDEIASCTEPIIFVSSELFSFEIHTPAMMTRLRDALSDRGRHKVRVVLTLRDVADFVNSVYSQRVRDGFSGSIADYIKDIQGFIDWTSFAASWAKVFGADAMILLKFEDLDRKAMVDDFARKVFGIDVSEETPLFPSPQVNSSLPHAAVTLLREVNASDMPIERKDELRNHLHAFFNANPSNMSRADFLSAGHKERLRRSCHWPVLMPTPIASETQS